MSSADAQVYAQESGGVMTRLGSHIATSQRQREGIMGAEEAADQFNASARQDKLGEEAATAQGATSGGAVVGTTTALVKGVRRAVRAGRALKTFRGKMSEFKSKLAGEGGEDGSMPAETNRAADIGDRFDALPQEEQARVQTNLNADETGTYQSEDTSESGLKAQNDLVEGEVSSAEDRVGSAPPGTYGEPSPPADDARPFADDALKPPDPSAPPPEPSDDLTAKPTAPTADDLLGGQVREAGASAESELGDFATKAFGGLGDVTDIAGALTGAAGDEGLTALGALGIGAEALGPLSLLAGAGVGIWEAVSAEQAASKAADNASKYQEMAQSLSAAPQLQTGSIALPVMDSTQFRSGTSNF